MSTRTRGDLVRLVKANDLDDEQIRNLWVPFAGSGGRLPFFDPSTMMATVVLGGKGSGKTHLLRYHSFPVQGLAYDEQGEWERNIRENRYVGVYSIAGGLNGSRFRGKGISEDTWSQLFRYYVDLWLAQSLLFVVKRIADHVEDVRTREPDLVEGFLDSFFDRPEISERSFVSLQCSMQGLQKEVDRRIMKASLGVSIQTDIRCSPSSLVFGFPRVLCQLVPMLADVAVCYYMDEYENFSREQQRYFNTLVRDRSGPVTFRIGARMYGMKTFDTDGSGEQIRDGSEYELLQLDNRFRADPSQYNVFCKELLLRRIQGWAGPNGVEEIEATLELDENKASSQNSTSHVHLERLRERLLQELSEDDVTKIVDECLRSDRSLLVEKAGIFMFYQRFASGETDLCGAAEEISVTLKRDRSDESSRLIQVLEHYRDDFRAQVRRDARMPPFIGTSLSDIITMSEGLPRVFLTIMKHVFEWAEFEHGRLSTSKISRRAAQRGLLDAAEWFQRDLPQAGVQAKMISIAVERLGELFRLNRYADKPVECSMIGFSIPAQGVATAALETIQDLVHRSFLIPAPTGEKDRNTSQRRAKYHFNRVLCPLFELSIGRRGAARFSSDEADAIFGVYDDEAYRNLRASWDRRVNWPFGRRARTELEGQHQLEFE